jgi:hypothetical protein
LLPRIITNNALSIFSLRELVHQAIRMPY